MEPGKTIVVAEQDDIVQEVVCYAIRWAFGQQVRLLEAADGRDVIRLALHERPDLVVLSDRLPSLSGRHVCRALKEDEETSVIRVMMLHTGDTPDAVARDARSTSISAANKL